MAPPTPTVTATTPTVVPTVTPPPTATAVATAAPSEPEGPRPFGLTPWFVVGGGGALAIVGAILIPVGAGNVSSAEATCPPPNHVCTGSPAQNQSAVSQGNSGRASGRAGGALIGVGLASAAVAG